MPLLKESKHFRFLELEFWAENGSVVLLNVQHAECQGSDMDVYQNAVQLLSPADFYKRVRAAITVTNRDYPNHRAACERFWDEAKQTIMHAKQQGDFTDPKVQRHFEEHEQPVQILVPGAGNHNATKLGRSLILPKSANGRRHRFVSKPPQRILLEGYEIQTINADTQT